MPTNKRRGCALILGLLTVLPSCSSPTDEYCEAARTKFAISGLVDAIKAKDADRIAATMNDLDDLVAVAPSEIYDDLVMVSEVLQRTIRRVTGVSGPNGEPPQTDVAKLNADLKSAGFAAQRVVNYTSTVCSIDPPTTQTTTSI